MPNKCSPDSSPVQPEIKPLPGTKHTLRLAKKFLPVETKISFPRISIDDHYSKTLELGSSRNGFPRGFRPHVNGVKITAFLPTRITKH